MHIYQIHVLGHSIRFVNDHVSGRLPPEPECWKTKIDEGMWTAGGENLACMLQVAIDDVLEQELTSGALLKVAKRLAPIVKRLPVTTRED